MIDVIIEVRGGTVVEVYSDSDELRSIVVDWDDRLDDDDSEPAGRVYPISSISKLPDDTHMQYVDAIKKT